MYADAAKDADASFRVLPRAVLAHWESAVYESTARHRIVRPKRSTLELCRPICFAWDADSVATALRTIPVLSLEHNDPLSQGERFLTNSF